MAENKREPTIVPPGMLPQPIVGDLARQEISFDSLPKFGNPVQPIIWVDVMTLALRAGAEGLPETVTLRFYGLLLEAAIETVRLQTSVQHLRAMMDVMAKTIDYYPTKPQGNPASR